MPHVHARSACDALRQAKLAMQAYEAESAEDASWALFEEPEGFRPRTPPPTYTEHVLPNGERVQLRLVGSHPLWGHYLWNAAPTLCEFLYARHDTLLRDRTVLELGAAAGLPSIAAARAGAASVVATDYPDPGLMENLCFNVAQNGCLAEEHREKGGAPPACAAGEGFVWGADPAPLLAHVPQKFDLLLLSDLIFNHQAHPALLDTCDACLRKSDGSEPSEVAVPCALVFFSHHRPHLAHKDMGFFTLAEERGYICTEVGRWRLQPMFPEDPGDEEVRATVHGWMLRRR